MTERTTGAGRVAARLARQVDVGLAPLDLSPSQYRTLLFLAEGDAAASALADRLAVSRPSVTAVVDGLVGRGLVERKADACDRRRVTHVLTEDGRRALERADIALDARLGEIAAFLPPESSDTAFAGLEAWARALDGFRAAKTKGQHPQAPAGGGDPR